MGGDGHETEQVSRGTDHRHPQRAPGGVASRRALPQVRGQRRDVYKWRSKYGGMEVSDARKLKGLEDENRRLKKLLAESMLDVATLRELLAKNF